MPGQLPKSPSFSSTDFCYPLRYPEPDQLRGEIIPIMNIVISRLSKIVMLKCSQLINVSNEFLSSLSKHFIVRGSVHS